MASRKVIKRVRVSITLPQWLVEELDGLAEQIEGFRTDVIQVCLQYCLEHTHVIDELFGFEEEGEEEEKNEDEEGEES